MDKLRYFINIFLIIFSVTIVFSQTNEEPKPTEEKTEEKTEVKNTANLPDGFENLAWGSVFENVKNSVKGKLLFADDNKLIVSKDIEITYKYGFFYKDPEVMQGKKDSSAEDTTDAEKGSEARLFFVAVEFPYLPLKDVREKTISKYGPPTIESINKNKGALVWESEKTTVIMWVDSYEKKPFCRKINYISKEISKELGDYHYRIFNSTEISVLNGLYK